MRRVHFAQEQVFGKGYVMGIDAMMLVRVKGQSNWLVPIQVKKLSYHVGQTFGANKFYISKESNRHALNIITHFENEDNLDFMEEYDGKVIYDLNYPILVAEPDEQFISVSLMTRYYGKGYERGDALFIIMIAEYLERTISGSEIWYGGDSGGVTPFGRLERYKLLDYFFDVGHSPYMGGWGMNGDMVPCMFCGGALMYNVGGGGKYIYHTCGGCGVQVISDNSGQIIKELKYNESFHDAHKGLSDG